MTEGFKRFLGVVETTFPNIVVIPHIFVQAKTIPAYKEITIVVHEFERYQNKEIRQWSVCITERATSESEKDEAIKKAEDLVITQILKDIKNEIGTFR